MRGLSPVPAALLLGSLGTAGLLAGRLVSVALLAALLFAVCLRAGRARRRPYLAGVLLSSGSLFLLSPFLQSTGSHLLWSGPILPVLGSLDLTREEIAIAALQALRLASLSLAFTAYALLLDHDRLLQAVGFARRSVLAVALATRLVPTLERDAGGLLEALRGRGVAFDGLRGRARLVSPLLAGSLERGVNLAEAMEARGYGRAGATRAPLPGWSALDRGAAAAAPLAILIGALWL